MSKAWRGKNNIPPKFPQKLYIRYGNSACFYIDVISSVPLKILDMSSYIKYHREEIDELGLTRSLTVPYGERIEKEILLKIKQLPWNPSLEYTTFKAYPKYSFSDKIFFRKEAYSTNNNILSKIFSLQQLLRNPKIEVCKIDLGCRKLGDIIKQGDGVSCRESGREKMLHEFYDNFSIRFPGFIEDICYSYLTKSYSYKSIVGINYSWMIQMILSSMYLIPSSW